MQTIVSMKHQFAELLASIGFIQDEISSRRLDKSSKNGTDAIENLISPDVNMNSKSGKLLVSLLCASLYPNVVQILSPKTKFSQTVSGTINFSNYFQKLCTSEILQVLWPKSLQ